MVSITASTLDTLLAHDTDISDAQLEAILDKAIGLLNTFGAEISLMSGTSGSKSWGGTTAQYGAILEVARMVYYSDFKTVESTSVGGLTVSTPDLLSNPIAMAKIRMLARQLAELEVSYG